MFTLGELAGRLGARVIGDAGCVIERVATLDHAGDGDISFLTNKRFQRVLGETKASAVILAESDEEFLRTNGLVVANPHVAFAHVASWLHPLPTQTGGVHPSASVDPSSRVHASAWIGPQVVVESGVVVEADCFIGPGCVVERDAHIKEGTRLIASVTICHGSQIGRCVLIHPGAVIGSDGFGLANDKGTWIKVPQIGRAIIGDDVEIGANAAIDRGAIEDTVIAAGVKLDNLVHVAHNVHIGEHTAIAGCTGIAGSTRIGAHCAIAGMVAIAGHIEITDNVTITGRSMVTGSINKPGVYSSGTPLDENARWHRNSVRFKHLDELARRVKKLEQQLEQTSEQQREPQNNG